MTLRARIGDVQPRRGLRDTPTGTARHPQLEIGGRAAHPHEKAVAGAASIEIGGRAERLHVQGVMLAHGLATKTFCDDLVKQLKVYIPIHTGAQGTVQIKAFEEGQTWLGMIGYIQKDQGLATFEMDTHNISEAELAAGRNVFAQLKTDYEQGMIILNKNNIVKTLYRSRSLGSGSSGKRSRQDSGGPSKKGRKGRGAADPSADKSLAAADIDEEGAGTRKARSNYSEAIKSSTLQAVAEYIRKHHQWPDGQQLGKIRLVVDPNREQFTGSSARQINRLI
ncbi:hypothetical protein WJX84_010750 [Apatococcus fuscideae]|uniref:Replitron HUH endonuclease domain-containing protein n=1 Tax=Apatococcus fuscideae TaxID=2026836 RepID=A0AAW1T055_9CHLO